MTFSAKRKETMKDTGHESTIQNYSLFVIDHVARHNPTLAINGLADLASAIETAAGVQSEEPMYPDKQVRRLMRESLLTALRRHAINPPREDPEDLGNWHAYYRSKTQAAELGPGQQGNRQT